MSIFEIEYIIASLAVLLSVYILKIYTYSQVPNLHFKKTEINNFIIQYCSLLKNPYVPTFFWGKSGHVQTLLYGKMGRVNTPITIGKRFSHIMKDGATMTYDFFLSTVERSSETFKNAVLLVCPGIANSSESLYIRVFVNYAQINGYHVAVLNHLGAIKNIPLTSSRIYNYGGTEEYSQMVEDVMVNNPDAQYITIGFSMGGNIVVKYLGEHVERQEKILGALSICQGYDLLVIYPLLLMWYNLRKLYVIAMTRNQKKIINWHKDPLFSDISWLKMLFPHSEDVYTNHKFSQNNDFTVNGKDNSISNIMENSVTSDNEYEKELNLLYNQVMKATTMFDIDNAYSHKRAGFRHVEDYYKWASSRYYIHNVTNVPLFILNANDDPIVPSDIFYIPKEAADKNENIIFCVTSHGGHLGYFEGGYIIPNQVTWLDKVIIEYCDALLANLRIKKNTHFNSE